MTLENISNQACQICGHRGLWVYSHPLNVFMRVSLIPQTNHGHRCIHGFLRPHPKALLLPCSLILETVRSHLNFPSQADPLTDSYTHPAAMPFSPTYSVALKSVSLYDPYPTLVQEFKFPFGVEVL